MTWPPWRDLYYGTSMTWRLWRDLYDVTSMKWPLWRNLHDVTSITWPPWHDLYDVTIHDMTSISWPPGTVYTWEVQVGEVGAPGHEAQQSSVSHSGTVLQLCQNNTQMITNTVVRWYLLRILKFQLMLLCKSEKTVLFYQIIKSTFTVFWKIGWFRLNKITSWYFSNV